MGREWIMARYNKPNVMDVQKQVKSTKAAVLTYVIKHWGRVVDQLRGEIWEQY